jgi:hypothetical protein
MPSEKLLIPYEKRKDDFVNKTMDNLIDVEQAIEDKKNGKPEEDKKEKEIYKAILELDARGITGTMEQAKILGVTHPAICQHHNNMDKLGMRSRNYLKNVRNFIINKEKSKLLVVPTPL